MSAYPYSPELEALYKFESRFGDQVNASIREGNTLYVPRESVPYAASPQDFRTYGSYQAVSYMFTPRGEQGTLVDQSVTHLQNDRSHIFRAPTGWGKTVAGSAISCKLGLPTLIVVTKEDLMGQWYDALTKILKVSPTLIGKVQGDVEDWKGKRFVLGMVQSLMIKDRYPMEFYRYFGLMILDECHMMAADCFVRVCQTVYAAHRLGFSATPERSDGKTKLLKWHIGPELIEGKIGKMKPLVIVKQTGWKIPVVQKVVDGEYVYVPIPHGPGRMMLVIKAMAANDVRNMEIVNFVKQAHAKGRTVLLLSDMIKHLDRMFQMITSSGIPGNKIGYYVGGMKKHEIALTKTCEIVLGTYQMCSTGTDCPAWDTLVMMTPRSNVTQPVGRVLREKEGKLQPVILDLVDYNSIFQGFHNARLKQYYAIGAQIVKK
jgi:superfamily II DNA or RNA helicase